MTAVKGSNTSLERKLDAAFKTRGWKYERNDGSLPGKPDFVFRGEQLIVFVDGDFWHGWRFPQWKDGLSDYWRAKIERTRKRDRAIVQRLRRRGWIVLRFWGHQVDRDLDSVLAKVGKSLNQGSKKGNKKGNRGRQTALLSK
jgi:DNA mismatch endonuclease (patch repair protein)